MDHKTRTGGVAEELVSILSLAAQEQLRLLAKFYLHSMES